MAGENRKIVFAAIAANFAIAVTKFVAAAATGSSAMLTEGVHSLVDTGNQGLLLVGLRASRRPPDRLHPFGHGKELYFYTLIVAVLIFGAGGGVSIYEGILHMMDPQPIRSAGWNYTVIGLAVIFEGASWWYAVVKFRQDKQAKDRTLWEAVRNSKDPTTFTVVFEDSAALAGLGVAGLGVWLSTRLGMPTIDGAASIGIGLILCFREGLPLDGVTSAVERLEQRIRSADPRMRYIFIEAESLKGQGAAS